METQSQIAADARHANGGVEIAFAPVVLSLGGLWLDRKVGTLPLFVVSFAVLGLIGSVANVYYRYRSEIQRLEEKGDA